jgi:hypothetical protein
MPPWLRVRQRAELTNGNGLRDIREGVHGADTPARIGGGHTSPVPTGLADMRSLK